MNLRRPTPADILNIFDCAKAAVWSKAAGHYDKSILRAWTPGALPERVKSAEAEMADPSVIHLVSEHENEILGFGIVIPKQNEFRALYVRPNKFGGVGKTLCDALLNQARNVEVQFLELSSSLNAVKFYQRMGAEIVGPIEHTFADGTKMSAMKMRFNLSSPTASPHRA